MGEKAVFGSWKVGGHGLAELVSFGGLDWLDGGCINIDLYAMFVVYARRRREV